MTIGNSAVGPFFTAGITFDHWWEKYWRRFDSEFEIPMPVGDPDGDMETVDIYDTLGEMRQADDQEALVEAVQKVGWIGNQLMPFWYFGVDPSTI